MNISKEFKKWSKDKMVNLDPLWNMILQKNNRDINLFKEFAKESHTAGVEYGYKQGQIDMLKKIAKQAENWGGMQAGYIATLHQDIDQLEIDTELKKLVVLLCHPAG